MSLPAFRLPAEWEPQAGVLVAWPHEKTDWCLRLAEVETSYVSLVAALTRYQPALICVPDRFIRTHAEKLLQKAGVDGSRVRYIEITYDDTWLRDSGPITLTDGCRFRFNDYRFTGWGGKYQATRDDELVEGLFERKLFKYVETRRIDWALEGGAIESDGRGTLLSTWRCLQHRHPNKTRDEITQILCETLGAQRVHWLEHGALAGDDTDAHIDTLARFAPNDGIVFQACDDPEDLHYAEFQAMEAELRALRTSNDQPYALHPLPWARPIYDEGRRLAASYANYLIINGAVLVPAYDDEADSIAAATIARAHPERDIISVPCRPLIWQNGSLHCITMQLPAGVFE